MKTYSDQFVSQEEALLFDLIKKIVGHFVCPDLGLNDDGKPVVLSCHLLSRAIGQVFGLKWVDGYFKPAYCHTWLVLPSGNILDVYPVGIIGGPILWIGEEACWNAPSRRFFEKRRLGSGNINSDKPWMRRSIRRVAKEIRRLKTEIEIS